MDIVLLLIFYSNFKGLNLEERKEDHISAEAVASDILTEENEEREQRAEIVTNFVKHVSMEVIKLADQVVNISPEDQSNDEDDITKKNEQSCQSKENTPEQMKKSSPPKRESSNLSLKRLSRETSNLSQSGISGLNREPSFIYDTTVEAFNCEGASVDDILDDIQSTEGQEDPAGISIIGKLVLSLDSLDDKDKAKNDTTTTKVSVAEMSVLSTSPTRMETVFLTESGEEQNAAQTSSIEIPIKEASTDDNISTTPEAEAYFMQREQSFINKVYTGEVHNLAVNVSNFYALDTSMSESDLTVKPVANANPEMEMEISSIETLSSVLTVKPMEESKGLMSSYEAIYDRISIEDLDHIPDQIMSTSDLLDNLGDRFEGTRCPVPDHASSFEDLYERSADNMAGDILNSAFDNMEPARWSAPAGSVEAPILEAEEFSIRFDPVAERIQGHWQELEILLEGGGG